MLNYINLSGVEMDIKMEITFSDGSSINLTEQQFKELKSSKISKMNKSGIDYLKSRILKCLKSHGGEVTSGRLVNILRCYSKIDIYNAVIESLINDGVIKIIESSHKYCKNKVLTLTLV